MGAHGFVSPTDICQLWRSARQCVRLVSGRSARTPSCAMWRNAFEVHTLSPFDGLVMVGESGSGPNLALEMGWVALPCVSAELLAVEGAPGRRWR